MKGMIFKEIKNYVLILIAILSAGMGIKGYLLSSRFIDGGVTGISMLLNNILGYPLAILIPLINLPFIILGYHQMGSRFAVRSCVAIAGLALCIAFMPYPNVTPDKLLTAVFGGFFLGVGIGLAIRAEAVLDGTEIAALLVSKYSSILKVADVILILNVLIFATAAFFLGVESASYSILTYFAASRTIEFLLYGLEEYTGVTIISSHSNEVRLMIINKMGRGVTVYKGKRGYGRHGETGDIDIIYSVITRLELNKLNTEIEKIDREAFVVMNGVKDTKGGMIKKRPLKH